METLTQIVVGFATLRLVLTRFNFRFFLTPDCRYVRTSDRQKREIRKTVEWLLNLSRISTRSIWQMSLISWSVSLSNIGFTAANHRLFLDIEMAFCRTLFVFFHRPTCEAKHLSFQALPMRRSPTSAGRGQPAGYTRLAIIGRVDLASFTLTTF